MKIATWNLQHGGTRAARRLQEQELYEIDALVGTTATATVAGVA
jgi:hypothetical protein